MTCIDCGSDRIENKELQLCASCGALRRKELRQAEKDALKEKKPIKKVSSKRAVQNKQYSILRKEYLEQWSKCEVPGCMRRSEHIHHLLGRENERLNDTDYWMAVCSDHHNYIHANPEWSRSQGYLLTRSI